MDVVVDTEAASEQGAAEPGRVEHGSRRSDLVRRGVLAGGVVLGGAALSGAPALTSAASSKARDAKALNLILLVEYAEEALYAEALKRGKLKGELREYATTVAQHEKAHRAFLTKALGGKAARKPDHDFGDATSDPDAFVSAAAAMEDLAVAAYNGQATNVSRETLTAAARIVSVEARHAAWIRSIVGKPPAPDATDRPRKAGEVLAALTRAGQRR
jgi:rubrerythrin